MRLDRRGRLVRVQCSGLGRKGRGAKAARDLHVRIVAVKSGRGRGYCRVRSLMGCSGAGDP